MTVPILATKLYAPPLRPELVSRRNLVEKLEAGLDRRLTIVSAPAGFGKTTLVSEWRQRTQRPAGWLSLDQDDNDPIRFWRYVIAALQTIDHQVGRTVQAALESGQQPPLNTLVTALVNDLVTLPSPFVLVLDDYHLVEAESIHAGMNLMLDRLPPRMHLIVTTRADPPFKLSLRRGRAEMNEIRTADLCFSADETAEFLNARMELDLSLEDVLTLTGRTEGWIVGLQMAAIAIRASETEQQIDPRRKHEFVAAFAGDDRYIGGYLVEEVLGRQPQAVQRFLLETSILDRFCAPLCSAVTEHEGSREIIAYLDRNNLFVIPLDTRRHWYRYHHLFADLLFRRLRQEKESQHVETLYLRASRWCESEGLTSEAVSYALAIPDLEWATTLVERHAPDVASRGGALLARKWQDALPEDRLRSSPYLCILRATRDLLAPPEVMDNWLNDAEKAWDARRDRGKAPATPPDEVDELRFRGWMAATRAWISLHRGHSPRQVIEQCHWALGHIPKDDLIYNRRARSNILNVLGRAYRMIGDDDAAQQALLEAQHIGESIEHYATAITAACNLARIALDRGQLRQSAAICQDSLHSATVTADAIGHPLPAAGGLDIILGQVWLEQNALANAGRSLAKGLEVVELIQDYGARKEGYIGLALLRQAQGDTIGSLELVEKLEQMGTEIDTAVGTLEGWNWLSQPQQEPRGAPLTTRLAAEILAEAAALRIKNWLAQVECDQHSLDQASEFARERRISLEDAARHRQERLALARLHIARWRRQHPDRAKQQSLVGFLDNEYDTAQKLGRDRWMIETLVLQAMAQQALDDANGALTALQQALTLGRSERFIRVFVDEGAPMARLLYLAADRGIETVYAGELLAAFSGTKPAERSTSPSVAMVETLSQRELEVLQLIAEGLSNRQIADRLVISPNTVRVHSSSIYGKLGVNSRTQAVAKARGLGILPSA